MTDSRRGAATGRFAFLVAAGILLSRLFGLVRVRVFSHYLGQVSDAADAFNAAFRIPNILQNLFGEGALSASFIPVYSRLTSEGDEREAGRVAGAVFGVLALAMALLTAFGIALTPLLIDVITPGFEGAKRELAIRLVRVLFPGAALFVMSAWCLGILNSHGRFFVSYAAPVFWNLAMIATLAGFGGHLNPESLVVALAWGSVAGALLMVVVQMPNVLRLAESMRFSLDTRSAHVRSVVRNFVPVLFSRGVVQVSSYVDAMVASLLPTGAVTGVTNAQLLYVLPVSLFGMSVSAAELPAMSTLSGEYRKEELALRINEGLRRIAFFVVPSAVAFMVLGDVVAGLVLQTGRFTRADSVYVWGILAGASIGLLATTMARLYSSAYYSVGDTQTPFRYALLRVSLAGVGGYLAAVHLPSLAGVDARWGAAGLTTASGLAGWVEFALLRGTLNRRVGGRTGLALGPAARLWFAAFAAAGVALIVKLATGVGQPLLAGPLVLGAYGLTYFAAALALGVMPDAVLRTLQRGRTNRGG
ncbi:MAG: murein biosynthesis integral membrane protein MurJ [Vicinamibacterales bacterium]